MGYTHYWNNKKSIPPDVWAKICDDADKILAASPVPLSWEYNDSRAPEVTREGKGAVIRFNGPGDEGCETFYVEPNVVKFEFCKTRREPYDIVVTAMLAMIADHHPAFSVSSDGDPAEWEEGLDLAQKVLGRPIKSPLQPAS